MKVKIVIQARMGSSRLKGKTLSPIYGIPLLKRVVDSAIHLKLTNNIVVVTSNQKEDDPIEAYCQFLTIKCLRGSTTNVFSRFIDASKDLNDEDVIVRITADNIFYQKDICQQLVEIHQQNKNGYTGIKGLSHIVGEFISVKAINKAVKMNLGTYDKEHVTPCFINNTTIFNSQLVNPKKFDLKQQLDKLLTIDTIEDSKRIEQLIENFEQNNLNYTKENLYYWLENKQKK